MQKINFQNLPSTTTPINATNLNAIQTNAETAINDVAGDLSDYVDGTTSMGNIKTTGLKINNVNSFPNLYSTNETQVGTWIDGKPLYRKTITFPNGTNGNTSQVTYNLSDYGISNVSTIFIAQPSYYTLDGRSYLFNFYDGNRFEAQVSPSQLMVTLGFVDIANSLFVITLEYTKTTD